MDLVQQFINSKRKNLWIRYPDMDVYVRDAYHRHPDLNKIIRCFDVANINVHTPNKGVFTAWFTALCAALQHGKFRAIYIESVLNTDFADYLRRRNLYEVSDADSTQIDFFFMLQ